MAFNFFDKTPAQQLSALYVGYFGRAADPDGLQFWINEYNAALAEGQTENEALNDIAESFRQDTEVQELYPFLGAPDLATPASIEAFLGDVYQNLFRRDPDEEGLQFWTGEIADRLNANTKIGDIIADIISGAQGNDVAVIENKMMASFSYAQAYANTTGAEWTADDDADGSKEVVRDVDESKESLQAAQDRANDLAQEDAEPTPPPDDQPNTQFFTTGNDDLVGGGADDRFAGTVSDQTSRDTFQPGDSVDGKDGSDTLEIELSGSDYDGNVKVVNVEKLFIETTDTTMRVFEAEELFNEGSTLEQIWAENISKRGRDGESESDQSGHLLIRDISTSDVTLGVLDSGANVTGAPSGDLDGDAAATVRFEFAERELTGDKDEIGLALNNAQNVNVDMLVGPLSNGIETLNVTSIDDFPSVDVVNSLNGTFDADGNATTMTVTGEGGFKARLADNFDTFDAGGSKTIDRATGDQDIVFLNSGTMNVIGGKGDDTFEITAPPAEDEKHKVTTNEGDDTVILVGDAIVDLGEGNDTLIGTGSDVKVTGGPGDDTVDLGDGNHDIDTGDGNDKVKVGDGNTTIVTGKGDDDVLVQDGDSTVSLGEGDDEMAFKEASHLTSGDTVDGGAGNDRVTVEGDNADIGASETLGLSGVDVFKIDGNNVTLKVTDGLVDQADNGFTVEVAGQDDTVDITDLAANRQISVNDLGTPAMPYDTTIRATDTQLDSKDSFDLGVGYDTLEVVDGATLRPADLDSFTGLDEIHLTVDSSTSQDWTIEPTKALLNPNQGVPDTFYITVDDDIRANSTLTIDVSEIGPGDLDKGDTLQIVNNAQVDFDEVRFVDDTGSEVDQPDWINVVTGLDLTSSSETLDGKDDLISNNDNLVVASEESDFGNDDVILGLGQNVYGFHNGGDTLLMQFNPEFLDERGVAFIGAGKGDDESNTGFLSQIWGHDADADDGSATVSGFERIKFDAADVSFVDDVTGDPPDGGQPYSEDNGNISDTGHVVFETAGGDDYIQTFDFNSTKTNSGNDTVELFGVLENDQVTVESVGTPGHVPAAQPAEGGNPVQVEPFRRHDTGSGNDRVVLNYATSQAALVALHMGEGTGDVVEIRSWDAVLPDGTEPTPTGDVVVGPGAFAGDSGLNIIEYASATLDDNGTTFLTLDDSDLAAFEQVDGANTAIIRPAADNQAELILDATALTDGNRVDVTGTQFDDIIETGEGDDIVNAGGGDDLIDTDGGDDTVNAGSGDDEVFAGRGDDTVNGGSGEDTIDGEQGDDDLTAGEGADTVIGGLGADTIDVSDNDNAEDTVVYRNENDGSQRGSTEGHDVVTGFVSGEDKVEIREPMASALDDDNFGNFDFADNNELVLHDLFDNDEAIVFDNSTLSDDELVDLDAVTSDFNTANSVDTLFGDEALIAVHGENDSALYHFRSSEGQPNSGTINDTSVENGELALLGVFKDVLLQENDFQFG